MNLFKGLLLGTAATFVVIGSANAADLPMKKSAPAEYVRVCSEHGKGFFYVPGSDTCIQIGGRVRADTQFQQTFNRNADSVNFGVQARINLDVRSNTPYGMVRAYLRYALTRGDSNWSGNYASSTKASAVGPGANDGIDLAYIQFAGLTAGRVQSFFDFYANNYNFASIRNSDKKTQALAYTANFGSGWSATIAIEDGNERDVYGQWTGRTLYGKDDNWGRYALGNGYTSAGQSVPDVVANILVNQSWGAAQLAAAVHQIRPVYTGTTYDAYGVMTPNGTTNWANDDTEYGFAVKGAVKLNLPMIAPGDELWAEVAYADGAINYLGADYGFHPNVNVPIADAFVGTNGSIKKTKGWSAMVDLLHYWTPSIRQNVFASYMKLDYARNGSGVVEGTNDFATYNYGFVDTTEWRVGTNLIWSPIKNFDIGVEVLYSRTDPKGRVLSSNNGYAKTISSDDQWQGRLRVQRDF